MTVDELQDSPVLTPEQVLRLAGADLDSLHFDIAVLCFRGPGASQLVLDAFPVFRIEPDILYGSTAHGGHLDDSHLIILPRVIWGGPVTAILLEELACLGVQIAIGFGAAGSLESPQHIGKVLVASRALCSDGTSREYTDTPAVGSDADLLTLTLEIASREGARPPSAATPSPSSVRASPPPRWAASTASWAGAGFTRRSTAGIASIRTVSPGRSGC